MKILLLGSSGLLGQAMSREIEKRGYKLRTAARKEATLQLDITRENDLAATIRAEVPDIIVNCVALVDVEACERDPFLAWQTNGRPAAFLADWSRATGGMLLHVSTDHYFVDGGSTAHDENARVSFVNEYSRTKYAAESFALTAPNALVLRTSIVGIRGWERATFAEWAIDVAMNDRPVTLFSDVFTSSIDTGSFSRAALDLAVAGNTGLFNLAAREVYSKEVFVHEVASQLGRKLSNVSSGVADNLSVMRAKCLGLDVGRAERHLGRLLPTLTQVVAAVLRDYRGSPRYEV